MSNEHHTQPAHPADPADPASLETRIADELRTLLDTEQREHDRLEAELTAVRARRDRYRRTLAQLTGDKPRLGRPPKSPVSAKPLSWQVSDRKIAEVWDLVRHRTDSFTANRIGQDTPRLSAETARRAFTILREGEYVRAVGKNRGGGVLLAVMPGAADREYPDGA